MIKLPDAPVEQVAKALGNRGIAYGQQEKLEEAIENFGRVIELPNTPVEHVANALVNRGIAYGQQEKLEEAIEDFGRVIELSDAPAEQVANALMGTAWVFHSLGEANVAKQYMNQVHFDGLPSELQGVYESIRSLMEKR